MCYRPTAVSEVLRYALTPSDSRILATSKLEDETLAKLRHRDGSLSSCARQVRCRLSSSSCTICARGRGERKSFYTEKGVRSYGAPGVARRTVRLHNRLSSSRNPHLLPGTMPAYTYEQSAGMCQSARVAGPRRRGRWCVLLTGVASDGSRRPHGVHPSLAMKLARA